MIFSNERKRVYFYIESKQTSTNMCCMLLLLLHVLLSLSTLSTLSDRLGSLLYLFKQLPSFVYFSPHHVFLFFWIVQLVKEEKECRKREDHKVRGGGREKGRRGRERESRATTYVASPEQCLMITLCYPKYILKHWIQLLFLQTHLLINLPQLFLRHHALRTVLNQLHESTNPNLKLWIRFDLLIQDLVSPSSSSSSLKLAPELLTNWHAENILQFLYREIPTHAGHPHIVTSKYIIKIPLDPFQKVCIDNSLQLIPIQYQVLLEGFVNVYRCLQNVADLEVAFVAKAWLGRRGLDLEPRVEGVSDATSNQEVELLVQ